LKKLFYNIVMQVVKNVTVFKRYNIHLKEQSPSQQTVQKALPANYVGDVCVIPILDAVSGSHELQHTFQIFVVQTCALESPDRHFLLEIPVGYPVVQSV
jgi:hypothetical protein